MNPRCYALLLSLLLALAAAAQEPAAKKPALPSEETVQSFLQRTFGYNPDLSWRVGEIKPARAEGLVEVLVFITSPQGEQSSRIYITPDGEHAVVGDLVPFGADPFARAREQLQREARGPSRGPADAPVTIVEFTDLQCPTCRRAEPLLRELLAEQPNVRFVLQYFPLPQHAWARQGAAFVECVSRQPKADLWAFVQSVYDQQPQLTEENAAERLAQLAAAAGADSKVAAACAASPDAAAAVARSRQLGESLGVTGTPTLFINGRRVSNVMGVPKEVLKALVEFEAQQAR